MRWLRILSRILTVSGGIVMFLCLFADKIGIGETGGFGSYQEKGTVIGGIAFMVGMILRQIRKRSEEAQPGP